MVNYCVVPKCHTEGGYKFPSDPELRRRWCIAIKREGPNKTAWTNTPNSVVCEKHFKPEDFKDPLSVTLGLKDCSIACRRFLKSGVVPSVFSFTASETSTKRDTRNEERRARAEKRIKLKEEQVCLTSQVCIKSVIGFFCLGICQS